MNPEKRSLYDETGEYDDNEDSPIDLNGTYNYYRTIYPRLNLEDIDKFSKQYRNGEEEKEDLVNFYIENKGDITLILENIPLSRNEDVERFVEFYEALIEEGQIKKYKKFDKTKKNVKLLDENNDEAEEAENGLNDLRKQIALKNERRKEDGFAQFAAKFGVDLNKCEIPDIDEEEFQKNRKNNRRKKAKK